MEPMEPMEPQGTFNSFFSDTREPAHRRAVPVENFQLILL